MSPTQPILMLTAWPERFFALPVHINLAASIDDALAQARGGSHQAIFVDAVLPGNQSAYRFLREYRKLALNAGPVFVMADRVTQADGQLVCDRGGSGLIAKDARAVFKALQELGRAEQAPPQPPPRDPGWLPAVLRTAHEFLASEAERVVRQHLASLHAQAADGEVSATALIQAIGKDLDDEEDRIAFAREATHAIRTTS